MNDSNVTPSMSLKLPDSVKSMPQWKDYFWRTVFIALGIAHAPGALFAVLGSEPSDFLVGFFFPIILPMLTIYDLHWNFIHAIPALILFWLLIVGLSALASYTRAGSIFFFAVLTVLSFWQGWYTLRIIVTFRNIAHT